MSEESRKWGEEAATWQQRQIEECPEELRPWLRNVHEVNRVAVDAVTRRNSLRYGVSRRQKWLEQIGADDRVSKVRQDLADLERQMPDADAEVERLKAASEAASLAYEDARLEWRIREVPEERREGARILLREERERLTALHLATPVDGGTYGAAAGLIFGLEFRLKKAHESGDDALAAKYEAALIPARARLAELQPKLDAHKQAQQDLKDEYERRLRELAATED